MSVNLDLYRVFCMVAQLKTISKAGEALYLSQSVTSRSIQQLEKQLGCKLFERRRYGVELTPEGQRLYNDIILPYERISSAEARLNADAHLKTGTINIGCSPLCLYGPLLDIIEDFHREHPGIKVNIDASSTFDIRDRLSTSLLDFALLSYPHPIDKNFTHTLLQTNHMHLCAGTAFSELKGKRVSLRELDTYPQVGLKRGISSENRELWYTTNDSDYDTDISINIGIHVLALVEHNLGIGLIMDCVTEKSIEAGSIFVINIFEELPYTNTYLVQNPVTYQSYAATALKKRILDYPWTKG